MPQIVKGGKCVFGWSLVHTSGRILIPQEAYDEYNLTGVDKLVLIPGSSTSGGFGLITISELKHTPFNEILDCLGYSDKKNDFKTPELNLIKFKKNRYYCWINIDKKNYFKLSPEVLEAYGIQIGDKLLVVRGSGHALSFIIRGKIVETVTSHPEIEVFK